MDAILAEEKISMRVSFFDDENKPSFKKFKFIS